jgi:hypothetical protein
MQIAVGRLYVYMTHIGGQERELGLDLNARSIPSKQRVDSEAVTKIMDAWQPAVRPLNMRHLEK